jgi:hypothetical protein
MPLAVDDHIDPPAPTPAAHKPRLPIRHRRLSTVPLGHLGGIGLDLMAAVETPNDEREPLHLMECLHMHIQVADFTRSEIPSRISEGFKSSWAISDMKTAMIYAHAILFSR